MSGIISEIMEWCQNDMNYLQELIDNLQDIVNNKEDNEIERYIDEILNYKGILRSQLERQEEIEITNKINKEKEETITNINCWLDNDAFYEWDIESFKTYIKFLEKLTGITNELGI